MGTALFFWPRAVRVRASARKLCYLAGRIDLRVGPRLLVMFNQRRTYNHPAVHLVVLGAKLELNLLQTIFNCGSWIFSPRFYHQNPYWAEVWLLRHRILLPAPKYLSGFWWKTVRLHYTWSQHKSVYWFLCCRRRLPFIVVTSSNR